MKKKILLLLISIICITGCNLFEDKYKDYEHYDLTNYDHKIYTYYRTQDGEKYAISLLTTKDKEKDMEGFDEGLLYEVGENDYILLDRFSGYNNMYKNEYIKQFTIQYKDRIYLIRGGYTFFYTLNKENTVREELRLDYSGLLEAEKIMGHFSVIDGVDDDYIYLSGSFNGYNGDDTPAGSINAHAICSLKDYKCRLLED